MIYINLLIIILLLIFIHELGHYTASRFFGAQVTDFSIGFGKSLFTFKDKKNTRWKISLIPLGGYVKIKGLESIFLNDKNKNFDKDSFQSLSLFKKIIILLAGSFFNILSAWICLFLICFFVGSNSLDPKFLPTIGSIMNNSAASVNDLKVGDIIYRVNGNKIDEFNDISKNIKNQNVEIEIMRDNNLVIKKFDLSYNNKLDRFLIGISPNFAEIKFNKYDVFYSLNSSFTGLMNFLKMNINLLSISFQNNTLSDNLAGPVGIVKNANKLMLDNFQGILFVFIFFSLSISIINLFPIPLLDGGHIVYFTIRRIFSDTLPHIITRIYLAVGITILSFLFIFVTYNDIFYK